MTKRTKKVGVTGKYGTRFVAIYDLDLRIPPSLPTLSSNAVEMDIPSPKGIIADDFNR